MQTTSDFLVQRLYDWGVRRVYGYPGDGINGVIGALDRAGPEKVRFIQTRHEESAAFMACAHAKFTGEVGVCIATSGPGAIHLLNGLYDAKKDHVPVVAIVGQQATTALGGDYQQEVDLVSLFKDVAHRYVAMVASPTGVRTQIDQAMRIAMAERVVTCVIIPNDLQEVKMQETPPRKHGTTMTGVGYNRPIVVPTDADLDRAAAVLNEGKKVAILVGIGAKDAATEVADAAEALGCGVAKALLGKQVLPDDLPFVTGPIGLLGSEASQKMIDGCDTLLMVGTSFPYAEFLPKDGAARAVQIDRSSESLNLRYPIEVPLHGDAKLTLQKLLPRLKRKEDRTWRQQTERNVANWWQLLRDRAHQPADPINPQRLFWEISPKLPENCIITADSGSSASWYARDLKFRAGMMGSLSGGLATMCPAVPYAIAAKFAFPNRCAVAFVGDGAMQMLGNTELITLARHYKEWADPRVIVVVLNNRDLNMVSWEQRATEGMRKFSDSQDLTDFNYAGYAELLGLRGQRVETPEALPGAIEAAFAADRPFVLDVWVDKNVPNTPPHITPEQAKNYLKAILGGDPDAPGMVARSFRDVFAGWLPKTS